MARDIAASVLAAVLAFEEAQGERVAGIWLNAEEVRVLFRRLDVFDVAANRTLMHYLTGLAKAPLMGFIFNAPVFQTDKVSPGCIFITGDSAPFAPFDSDKPYPLPPG